MNDGFNECLNAKDMGKSPEEAASLLHDQGLTIVETIKVIMKTYDLSLRAAKSVVAAAPKWNGIVEGSVPLHDEAERGFREGAISGNLGNAEDVGTAQVTTNLNVFPAK